MSEGSLLIDGCGSVAIRTHRVMAQVPCYMRGRRRAVRGTMTNPTDIQTTGRFLVLLEPDAVEEGTRALTQFAGLRLVSADDAGDAGPGEVDGVVLPALGVAVVTVAPEQSAGLTRAVTE